MVTPTSRFRTPLALFVFNRPRHARRALEAIGRLERREEAEIIVFADGPRHEADLPLVEETRAVVRELAPLLDARYLFREQNIGLSRSISGVVSDLTASHGQVIVLEDDLVPAPDFLPFMLDGLARYANDPRVMQVSGCTLPGSLPVDLDGTFLPLTTSWGWATWERAWHSYQPLERVDRAELDRDPSFRQRFNADGAYDYGRMLDDRFAGRNDSWAILWWLAVARASGLVLYPAQSLIWNGGFDSSGVHCGGVEEFSPIPPPVFRSARLGRPLRLPEDPIVDQGAWRAVKTFMAGPPQPEAAPVSSIGQILRRLVSRV